MSTGLEQTNVALPRAIRSTLRRLIRRARWVMFLRGVCGVAAVATLAVLLVMAVDDSFTFTATWPRWTMSGAALALTLLATALFLVRPLAHSFTLRGIARAVESKHPELQERISSAVELLTSKDAPELRGSQALIAAVVAGASEDVRLLRPRREVTLRGARPFVLAAALTLAILGGLMYNWPHKTGRLLARAMAPFMNLPNVAADELTVVPGDTVIKPGESLRVDVLTANLAVRGADVHLLAPDGTVTVRKMMSLSEDNEDQLRFSAPLPPAGQDFRYRIRAGDALTRYYYVTVAAPPAVTSFDVRYDYPPYTHRKPLVQQNAAGDISAVTGTHVTVTAHVDKPVSSGALYLGDADVEGVAAERQAAADGGTTCTFAFDLTPGLKGYWHMTVKDSYAFTNPEREYSIEAVPDMPPTLLIAHPRTRQNRLKPTDSLPVVFAAQDDLGLASLDVLLKKDGQDVAPISIPLTPDEQGVALNAAGQADVDLASTALQGASRVEFRLRARDYLPPEMGGPHETLSDAYTITVDRRAPDYADQVRATLEDDIRSGLEEALKELQDAQTQSGPLREELPKARAVTQPIREALSEVSTHLAAADASVRDAEQKVLGTPFAPMGPKLDDVSTNDIAKAQEATGQVSLSDDRQQRADLGDEADTRIQSAVTKVSDLLKQFNAMAEALRQMGQLQDMAEREEGLADTRAAAEEATPPAPEPDQGWQQEQQDLVGDLSDFLRQTPEAMQAQLNSDTSQLEDLASRARKLQEQQQDLAADTQAVNDLQASDQQLQKLAGAQQDLAQRAGSDQASANREQEMASAAEDIRSGQLAPAVEKQQQAEQGLNDQATALRQQEATAALAARAEQIARDQRELANQARQAQQAIETARTQAASPEGQTASAAHEGAVAEQQLTRMAGRQPQLQKQAQELAEAATPASPTARQAVQQHDPTAAMAQASAALDKQDAQGAVDASRQAAEQAEALASALRSEMAQAPQLDRRYERATRMTRLAMDQAALRQQVQDLLQQRQHLRQQLQDSQVARLQQEQADVARQAHRPGPARTGRRAPAGRAARAGRAERPGRRRADGCPRPAPGGAERQPGRATALRPGRPPAARRGPAPGGRRPGRAPGAACRPDIRPHQQPVGPGAWPPPRRNSWRRPSDLAQEAGDVQGRLGQLFPQTPASQAASHASQFLDQAAGAQQHAEQALSSGAPEQAVPHQTSSAADLGHAADALQQAGQLFAQAVDALQLPEGLPDNAESGQLVSEAFEQAGQAAQTQQSQPASTAAQDLHQAAQMSAQRAEQMGLTPFSLQQYLASRASYSRPPSTPTRACGAPPTAMTWWPCRMPA